MDKKRKISVDIWSGLWYTKQAHFVRHEKIRLEPEKLNQLRKKCLTNEAECYIIDKLTSRATYNWMIWKKEIQKSAWQVQLTMI